MADKKRGRGRPAKKQEITPEIHLPDMEDTSSQHSFKDSKSLVHPSASAGKKDGKGASSSLNPSPLQLIREALEKDKNQRSLKKNSKDSKKMNVFELKSDDEDPVPKVSTASPGKKMAPQARRTKTVASDESAGKGGKGQKSRVAKKTKGVSPAVEEEEPSPKKRGRTAPAKKATAKKQTPTTVSKKSPTKRQPSATKSPQKRVSAKKQQKTTSPSKPLKATKGRGRGKASSPSKPSEGVDDTPPTQASDKNQDSDTEDLEEVTALTLTKPGGRKRKSPGIKQRNPPQPAAAVTAATQKPKSKRARLMDQGDSPNLKSASSHVTDEPSNEEEMKGETTVKGKVAASPSGGVSTRRRGGRKRKVREREEKEEEEEEEGERKEDNVVEQNQEAEVVTDVTAGDMMEKTSSEGIGEEDCTTRGVPAEPMEAETLTNEEEQKPLQTDSQEGEVEEATCTKVQTKRRKAVSERSRSKPSEEEDTTSNGRGEGLDKMGEADKSTERSGESEEMVVGGDAVSEQSRGSPSSPLQPASCTKEEPTPSAELEQSGEGREGSAVEHEAMEEDKGSAKKEPMSPGPAVLPELPDLPTPKPSPSKLELTPRKDAPSLSSLTKRPPSLVKSPSWPKSATLAVGRKKSLSQLSVMKDNNSKSGGGGSAKGNISQKEKGEKQMFFEELYYLLDNFVPAQSMSIRGFSVVTMATNCQKAEFRKKLNMYHLAPRIMTCLMDAPRTALLRLSTSLLMFMLTRDLGPLYFDKRCFILMANILESEVKQESSMSEEDSDKTSREYTMLDKKVRYCLELSSREHYITTSGREQADQIATDLLSAGDLIVESLVSVTNPRRRQHFKNALRQLGVLDPVARRVMNLITAIERVPPSDLVSDELDLLLKRTQRGLVVLEQVILSCYDNQCYLVVFEGLALLCSLCKLLRCLLELVTALTPEDGGSKTGDSYCNSYSAVNCLLTLLKLLTGITHDNEMACIRLGENAGVMDLAVKCTLQVPHHFLTDDKFYVTMLGLTLLLNLTEHSPSERAIFKKPWYLCQEKEERGRSVLHHITSLFLRHYRAAEDVDINLPTMVEQGGAQVSPTETGTEGGGEGLSSGQSPEAEGVERETLPMSRTSSAQSNLSLFLERGPSSAADGEGELERQSSAPRAPDNADITLDESFEFVSDEEDTEGDGYDHDKSVADLSTSLVINRDEFNQALEQAGQHLEDSMTACYCALLLGMLAKHDRFYRDEVKKVMPSMSFSEMIKILENFLSFLDFAKLGSRSSTESVRAIVTFLSEDCQPETSDVTTQPSQVDLTDSS